MAKTRRRLIPPLTLPEGLWESLVRTAEKAKLSPRGGQPLADAVAAASALYTGERGEIASKGTDPDILAARLLFFAVRDFSKVVAPLDDLWAQGWRPASDTLRVLDLGAGVGASGLGAARFASLKGISRVHLTALDREQAALNVARPLFHALAGLDFVPPVELETRATSVDRPGLVPDGSQDVVIVSFVLNEMLQGLAPEQAAAQGATWLRQFFRYVAPGGALVILEPATKASSRLLSSVRDVLAARGSAPFVVAPCLDAEPCPMLKADRDWCHQSLPLALPPPWDDLARAAGLRYEGLSYSYLSLRHDPPAIVQTSEGERRLRIVSGALVSKGKREVYGCADGELVRLTRLDRHAKPVNQVFKELNRGDVLRLRDGVDKAGSVRIEAETSIERDG